MLKLMIVVASTRPGRVGAAVGAWFQGQAAAHDAFDVDFVDLAELGLPFMDEPNHPRLRRYTQPHTLAWSARVDAADAFVFVMPEYNHGFTAPLKNALDYLYQEWNHKPVGFVSYGGVAAGSRAVGMLKPVITALNMMPLPGAVSIPYVARQIGDDGVFRPDEQLGQQAQAMLTELAVWAEGLQPLGAARGRRAE